MDQEERFSKQINVKVQPSFWRELRDFCSRNRIALRPWIRATLTRAMAEHSQTRDV